METYRSETDDRLVAALIGTITADVQSVAIGWDAAPYLGEKRDRLCAEILRRMGTAPPWTTEKPREAGWYWVWEPGWEKARPAWIDPDREMTDLIPGITHFSGPLDLKPPEMGEGE